MLPTSYLLSTTSYFLLPTSRLCPASEPLTEACFQRAPLEFDRRRQVLKWNNGSLQYAMGDKAVFVDGDVTHPPGSTWARNPIPRIFDSKLGLHDPASCPGPTTRSAGDPPGCLAFPAPCPWDTYTTDGLVPCGGGGVDRPGCSAAATATAWGSARRIGWSVLSRIKS